MVIVVIGGVGSDVEEKDEEFYGGKDVLNDGGVK